MKVKGKKMEDGGPRRDIRVSPSPFCWAGLSLPSSLCSQLRTVTRDFPGGAVAKTLRSQCRGPGFDP